MSIKLNKVFDPLVKMVSGKSGSKGRKKSYKYRVVVKGSQISKHYTKRAADKAAKGVRGASVRPFGRKASVAVPKGGYYGRSVKRRNY